MNTFNNLSCSTVTIKLTTNILQAFLANFYITLRKEKSAQLRLDVSVIA